MIALITAALQGLAAIPKIGELIQSLINGIINARLEERIQAIEQHQETVRKAYDQLDKAKTSEEKSAASRALTAAWSRRV